jgi:SET domain-containing protein
VTEVRASSPDDGLEVRRSPVHGTGVFARRPFAPGELVTRQEGVLLEVDELREDLKAIQIGPRSWLLADPNAPHPSDEINHSCDPNLGFTAGDTALYALRPIAPGDELTFDYSTAMEEPWFHLPVCECGAETCRGQVQRYSALPVDTRRALRPLAMAWLRALPLPD